MWKITNLKLLFQPRSSPSNSQETKQALHSFTHNCTVGASLIFFLMDPREIFQLNKRQVEFSSRGSPRVLITMGLWKKDSKARAPSGVVISSRKKKKSFTCKACFLSVWKLKMAEETTSFFELQSLEYFSTFSPEITSSFLNPSRSGWRSTSSKRPPLAVGPSFTHLLGTCPAAPTVWPPQLALSRLPCSFHYMAKLSSYKAWQISTPLNIKITPDSHLHAPLTLWWKVCTLGSENWAGQERTPPAATC